MVSNHIEPESMKKNTISRRRFITASTTAVAGSAYLGLNNFQVNNIGNNRKEIVSIVRVRGGNIARAVEEGPGIYWLTSFQICGGCFH
jgi:hypothetical protein